jgi:hypothetical protein
LSDVDELKDGEFRDLVQMLRISRIAAIRIADDLL